MRSNNFSSQFKVVLLAPTLKDAELTAAILRDQQIASVICSDLKQVCDEIERGADAAILTEEAIIADSVQLLEKTLDQQPPWSDFPLIVLMPAGKPTMAKAQILQSVGNMTLIGRPVAIETLISTVKAALRDRKRQYGRRDYLIEQEIQSASLAVSETRVRMIIDTALDAVIMADQDGLITEWNGQAEKLLGWSRDEALGQQIDDMIIASDFDDTTQQGIARYLAANMTAADQRIEIKAQDKNGRRFPIELTVTSQKLNGRLYFTSFMRDITQRLAVEQSAREAREHLELMVESAKDFVIVSMDVDGRIVSWNPGAERILGYCADEVLGQSSDIMFTPEDRAAGVPEKELLTASDYGRCSDERWHIRKNGERFYASGTMAAMYDGNRRVKGFIKIARDNTRQKQAEQSLIEARNAAEAASIAKTEFLANMSHEIRTPMNAVIGLSHILSRSEPLTLKQREYIKTLQMSADSLLALINDLLDIAKIEARTVELEHVPFSVSDLVQEVVSMMAGRVKEKHLDFTGNCAAVQDAIFIGDPTRLRQILLNLCSNAIKFTEHGSISVDVTASPMDERNSQRLSIAVTDTGIGIAEDKIETIFEKFVQADTSINRKYGGTGLGLAITKTLTEIMGGTITLHSQAGKGSTFTISIPLVIGSNEDLQNFNGSLPVILAPEPVTTEKCILLVEDYPANILVASTYLEQFGYRYDVANDGEQAIEKFNTGRYALILMDVQMPGMNGLDATSAIRELEKQFNLPAIPVIGMTAHALMGDRERCLAVGMDDYISKPFNPNELEKILQTYVA